MKLNKSKFLLILILVLLFSSLSSLVIAAERELEVEYPEVPGATAPTPTTTLPGYIKYIFQFSLIVAGILAFVALIYGGFRYLTSAGSPESIREAKSWIFGGILGLALLLFSYLILITINPELLSPRAEPLKPATGIYLINATDERLYVLDSQNKISFEAVSIEFISPSSELISVFVSIEEIFDITEENPSKVRKIINQGTGSTAPVSNVKSIYFLWNKPGIYLYAKENFDTPPLPSLYQSSPGDLKDSNFNDKAKSLKIKNFNIDEPYWTVLFEHIHFKGKCEFSWQDAASFSNKVKNDVSSIAIFRVTKQYTQGEIIFYDSRDCQGNAYPWEPLAGAVLPYDLMLPPGELKDVLSFEINGNFSILLNTKEDLSGRCQLFIGRKCHTPLKGTYVYSSLPRYIPWTFTPNPLFFEPKRAQIFPIIE